MPNTLLNMVCLLLLTGLITGAAPGQPLVPSADFNGDGHVNLADHAVLGGSWMDSLPWFPDGLLPQMLAYWPLDENALDSQNAFDGVVYGTPTWYTKKGTPNEVKVGSGALGLDGQDYLVIPGAGFPHFHGSFTIAAWIKTSYTGQAQTIISKGSGSWQFGLEATTGRVFLAATGLTPTGYLAGHTFLADGLWHHVAGVYDHEVQQWYLYVDGRIDAQADACGTVLADSFDIWIGGDPETQAQWWIGNLDAICMHNEALTTAEVFQSQTYHVSADLGQDDPNGPDPEWGGGRQKPFRTIQHALDVARDGDLILVWPGLYRESLFFGGKAVTVRSAADAAILEPDPGDPDGITVTFMCGEQADSVLEHFVLVNANTAVWVHQSSPTLRHLTVVNNDRGVRCIFNAQPTIEHSIFWNNVTADLIYDTYAPAVSHCCLQTPFAGPGNFQGDPCFVNPESTDPNTMDFHLRSQYGRYQSDGTAAPRPQPANWVIDDQTSPCIDAGLEDINPLCETMSNGGRINLGAHGNTPFASQSPWPLPADADRNGRIDLADTCLFSEQWLSGGGP